MASADRAVSMLIYAGFAYIAATIASETVLAKVRRKPVKEAKSCKKDKLTKKEGWKGHVKKLSRYISSSVEGFISKARAINSDVKPGNKNTDCDVTSANTQNVSGECEAGCDSTDSTGGVNNSVEDKGLDSGVFCDRACANSDSDDDSCVTDLTDVTSSSFVTSESPLPPDMDDVKRSKSDNNGSSNPGTCQSERETDYRGDAAQKEVSTQSKKDYDVTKPNKSLIEKNMDEASYQQQLRSMESEMLINSKIIESGVDMNSVQRDDSGIPQSPAMDTITEEEEEGEINKENNRREERCEVAISCDDAIHINTADVDTCAGVNGESICENAKPDSGVVNTNDTDCLKNACAVDDHNSSDIQTIDVTNEHVTSQCESSHHSTVQASCVDVTMRAENVYCDALNADNSEASNMGQSCVSGKTEAPMESVEKTDETQLHVEETSPYTKEIEQSKVSSPSNGDPTVNLPTENTLKKEEIKPEKVTEEIEEKVDEITENVKETKTDELRTHKEDASKARKDTTVKVIGNQLAFHGTRSLSGSPTLCSMAVKLWIANENDDDAVDDFGVHVGTVEGLTSNKSKIYVKITIENPDSDMKRIKKKTKPKKLTQTVTFGKDVVLHKVPPSFANRGRLTVAVWSQSAKKNKRLCDVDIELGRQTRFGDQKNDVMTFSQKLSSSKDRTDATLYLC